MNKLSIATLPHRGPGRPREFDMDAALDGAVQVFRQRGYHATSITDLGAAMGLTSGSIYKAFGDKRTVFLAAFDRYTGQRHDVLRDRLARETTGRDKIRAMLLFYAESSSGEEGRRGCLVAGSAAALAILDEEMAQRVAAALRRVETVIGELIRQGRADGSLTQDLDIIAVSRSLLCLLQGLRVIGTLGCGRDEMVAAVEAAMRMMV
jgi:AcrR family transcriptional regulator